MSFPNVSIGNPGTSLTTRFPLKLVLERFNRGTLGNDKLRESGLPWLIENLQSNNVTNCFNRLMPCSFSGNFLTRHRHTL